MQKPFRILRIGALVAAAYGSVAAQAQSLTLNFDNLSTPQGVSQYGLQLNYVGVTNPAHYVLDANVVPLLTPPLPTGKFLAYYALESQYEKLSLAPSSPGTFSLNSVDLAGLIGAGGFQRSDQLSIRITGTKLDGSTVSTPDRFDLSPGAFTTFGSEYFAGFTGLTSLQFSGTGTNNARYVGIDNLSLTIAPVPEPETYAMLLAGLGLLAAVVSKRKSVWY